MRDITAEDTIYIAFTTRAFATGIPTVLAGSPIVSAYEDAGLTQITAGITLGVDHDGVVGLNMLTIVATAANGYDTGKDYNLVITVGTVGGVSVVGEVVGQFNIERSAAAVDLANATDGLGALKAETALIVADTNELQTDDIPGKIVTLDAVVDTVKAETVLILADTTLIVADTNELQIDNVPGLIATAQADLDIITGADGAIIVSTQDLTATMKTSVNTEVDNALDTALPASPTSGSINDILDRQEELLVNGSAATGTLSTTEMTTGLTISVADQYNGRLITFRKDTTTAALRGQQTDITATTVLNGKLGFTALTTAPANGDLFDIT